MYLKLWTSLNRFCLIKLQDRTDFVSYLVLFYFRSIILIKFYTIIFFAWGGRRMSDMNEESQDVDRSAQTVAESATVIGDFVGNFKID